MLKVKLFGLGQATYSDTPLPGFPNQQAWLLLCYLLLNKTHPQNRERLAAVFWEDQPAHIARKNFRNSLWRLRQVFFIAGARPDDYLHVSDECVSFITYAPHWVDVDAFESAARLIHLPEQALSHSNITDLESAVDLYCGDLLENVYEDWCLYDRERLRLTYLHMLNRLMAYYATRGDYTRGLNFGQRLLAYDNTREDVHRQMIWLYWHCGDRNAALAQYKVCSQILREEIGVTPMESTRQLYEQVLRTPPQDLTMNRRGETIVPLPPEENAVFPPLAQNALQQLHHLQEVLEQTNVELLQIERMIYQALANSRTQQ